MKKINCKILSIPPYISTSWKNISTLHMKEVDGKEVLVVTLQNGAEITLPNLDGQTMDQIFSVHSKFLEEEPSSCKKKPSHSTPSEGTKNSNLAFSFGIPFPLNAGEGMENFSSFLQHNSEQAHAPDLPEEVVAKIRSMTEAMGINLEQMNAPKAEPHCNCMYCQIVRAIQDKGEEEIEVKDGEEEVSAEDLTFRDWEIKSEGDKRYLVTNPLDQNEHYQVYLGDPIGCTCGEKNCEHIRIVLSS